VIEPRPNLRQYQSQPDIEHLIGLLAHPDAEIRRRAAMALRTLEAVQAVPALKAALARESDIQVRVSLQVAIQALGTIGVEVDSMTVAQSYDVQALLQVLHSRNAEQAIIAARALGELGDRRAVEPLIVLFHDSQASAAVRLAAAEALLALKCAPSAATLLGALRREEWQVRCDAVAVLGQMRASWAVASLAALLDDPHPEVRRTAMAALRRIGTEEALAALHQRANGSLVNNEHDPLAGLFPDSAQESETAAEQPSPEGQASPEDEQPGRSRSLERPVNRLIAFLKPRE